MREHPPVRISAAGVSKVRPADILASQRGREEIQKSSEMMQKKRRDA